MEGQKKKNAVGREEVKVACQNVGLQGGDDLSQDDSSHNGLTGGGKGKDVFARSESGFLVRLRRKVAI